MEKLLFVCNWEKDKKNTWSGTPYHLREALANYFEIVDCDVSLNYFEKVISKLLSFRVTKKGIISVGWVLNPVYTLIMKKKAKKIIKKYSGKYVLEIGDFYAANTKKIFSYQDLNVLKLYDIFIDNNELFQFTGYTGTLIDLKKRVNHCNKFYNSATECFFMNQWMCEYTSKKIDNKCQYVGAGANVTNCDIIQDRRPYKYLFIGRDFIRKGGDIVVKAFEIIKKRHKEAELHICGPADIGDIYKIDGVILHGDLDYEELHDFYSTCCAFVMPSRFEAFGLVFIESLINGCPVIANDDYEMKYIVKNNFNGYLIKNEDYLSLAKYMEDIVDNQIILNNIKNQYEFYKNEYTWDCVAKKMYSEIIKN